MADCEGATDRARGSPLLTKREAAAFCRVSLRTFERFVQRDLPAVPIGARVFFAAQDVQRWLDDRRHCEWNQTRAAATISRAPRTRATDPMSRDESKILALLRRQHP